MTDPTRFLPHDAREELDADSLSWLGSELRSASVRFCKAIDDAARQSGEPQMASVHEAQAELGQTGRALRIVDVPGLSVMISALEELLERIAARRLSLTTGLAQVAKETMQALVAYLDFLQADGSHQSLRLFPAYRTLLEAMGADRIHPADLFFPARHPAPAANAATRQALTPEDLMRMRRRFEEALLKTLKSPSPEVAREHVHAMRQIIADIGAAQDEPSTRAFWQLMSAFAEVAEAGDLSLDIRQVFAQLNLRLRRMGQEQTPGDDERLKREALFTIAISHADSPALRHIRDGYGLDGLIPPDFVGSPVNAHTADVLPQARHRLAQAKSLWERYVSGDAETGAAFTAAIHALRAVCESLDMPQLAGLLTVMADAAQQSGRIRPWDELGLEMETSLLFVENALENVDRLPDDFTGRASAMASRLSALAAAMVSPGMAEGPPEAGGKTSPGPDAVRDLGALIGELEAGLRHVERMLEEYFRDPAQNTALHRLDLVLGQVESNLVLLDQPEAVRALQYARATVRRFMGEGSHSDPDPAERQRLARNLGTLDNLVLSLRRDAAQAREGYRFDDMQGLLEEAPPNHVDTHSPDEKNGSQQIPTLNNASSTSEGAEATEAAEIADVPVLREKLDAPAANLSPPIISQPGLSPAADLIPLFLEEAQERLADLGHTLQSWREQPGNAAWGQSLLRQIHTLKGSARMAGASALGKHLHDMEAQVSASMQRPLSMRDMDTLADFHDRSLALFDDVRQTAPRPAASLVRVRVDLLERLMRQAAKAGLLNAKMDAGLDNLRQTVTALAQDLAALRLDLREVDTHVAAQMSARLSIAGNKEFDPAEFDRLSRLQELARTLAKGVDQADHLQQTMMESLDNSNVDLAMQSRLATDMQQNLARIRRARLSGIADRLQHVVRQTAKEAGKAVRLTLSVGSVELDRDLLDRLPPPLEHLLRNAVVHGIEAPGDRRAAGKEETGELTLEAWQEGQETVIRVADDGRGLNLHRIRRKGMQLGLLTENAALSDEQTQALIFYPGFSTADDITPLAGRGMGLDAARAEIERLGGRLVAHSVTGKGVQFIIRLPGAPDRTSPPVAPVEPVAQAAPADRPTIMVVDDSHSVRRAAQRVLTRAGYHPVLVKDGREALEKMQTIVPAVMLIDAEMPHLDGFGLLRAMRDDARLRNIPVIMISSRTTVRHRDSAAALGVRAYLGKPYREEELLSLIGELIAVSD